MDPKAKNLVDGMERELQQSAYRGGMVPPGGRSPGAFVFASAFGPRIMLAPPGEGGDGGSGGDGSNAGAGSDGGAGGGENNGQTEENKGADGGAQKPERPDYIPENWWDADKGFKSEDFDALVAFKAESDSKAALVPEKPEGYAVGLPKDFKLPEGFELPEGQEAAIDENDPRVGISREFAHKSGFTQGQFEELIAIGVQMDFEEQSRLSGLLQEQADKLGTNGKARISAVTTWLGAKLGGEHAQALAPMLYTAKQVEAFERLMQLNRGGVPGSPGAGRDGVGGSNKIEGYDKMNFRQRMAAIDAMSSDKR